MPRVLIVDDREASRYLLRTLLEAHGHEVIEVTHGEQALAEAARRRPDLAVSDLLMPEMDGYALCRAWHADEALADIPFIIYSATYTEEDDAQRARQLGAAAFVRKPAEPAELMAVIERVLAAAQEGGAAGSAGGSAADPAEESTGGILPVAPPPEGPSEELRLYNRYLVEELERRLEELQRAYRKLEEASCRLSAIVDSSMDALMGIAPDGRIASWNPACTAIFGYTSEEAVGQPFTLLIPEEHHHRERERIAALGVGEREVFEGIARRKDGFEIEVAVTLTRLSGGLGWSAICRDLTPMRLAEREARAAESRYQRLAEGMPDIIFRYRLGWDIGFEYVSAAATRILGISPDAHYADPEAWHKLVDDKHRPVLEALLSGEERQPGEATLRFSRADGEPVWLELRHRVLHNSRGEPVAVEGVARDVSEQARARAELSASNARLQLLLASSPTVVYSLVEDGDELVATWVSQNITRMFGWSVEECLQPGWWQGVVHPEDAERLREDNRRLKETGTISHVYRVRHKDGSYRWVQDDVARAESDGQPDRYVGAWRDITAERAEREAREQLQAQLVQAQKLEALGTLAGGVAHDFNNYLTAILAYAGFVKDELEPGSQAAEDIERVIDGGQRSARLVSQLLAFSRQQVVQPLRVDVNEVVHGITRMLRRLIGEDIQLRTNLSSELRPVLIDPGQLEQVLMNLAVNARDAMPRGGELHVSTALRDVDEATAQRHAGLEPGVYVVLEVADTGVGMDETTRRRAFEPFFTTKEVGRGTGLGLATVYGIVKQADGYIMLDSEPGRGTRFTILLPALVGHASLDEVDVFDEPETLHGQETVLVVEDDRQVRESTRRMLMSQGYDVLVASNAGEALLICERHEAPIHLMLTDIVMPMMSGVELVERARPLRPHMRALFMTGYTDDASVRHGLGTGVQLIRKPFTAAELARTVAATLAAG
ncbi:MAG: PAS domain S-box protein, partial [Deltaproteobacteria bacterium]